MSGSIEVRERPKEEDEEEVKPNFAAREEAARRQNRVITKTGEEMIQYIQNLYDSGARMWTKDMFRDIEADMASDPRPHFVMLRSMNGEQRRKQFPTDIIRQMNSAPKSWTVAPHFKIYQELIYDAGEECFELDPAEDTDSQIARVDVDDDRTLATRTLTLVQTSGNPLFVSYDQLKAAWDVAWCNWNKSAACAELKDILGRRASFSKPVTKIVCFGLGSLGGLDNPSDEGALAKSDGLPRLRAMTQHAAALTMAAVLGERLGINSLPILAQDPAYSATAKQLLTEVGIEVVGGRGALAFTHVDDESIVFTCSPNIAVKQIVADIARPAAMVCNRVTLASEDTTEWVAKVMHGEEVLFAPWSTDPDSPRTRNLVEGYDEFDFPEEPERFGDLKIYVCKD